MLHIHILKGVICMCEDGNINKGDEDMARTAEKLTELRKAMKSINKDIPVLKSGKKDAIELDPKNTLHRKWYEGR